MESLGNTWTGQELLFEMLQAGKLLGDLKNTAALKLMTANLQAVLAERQLIDLVEYLTTLKTEEPSE